MDDRPRGDRVRGLRAPRPFRTADARAREPEVLPHTYEGERTAAAATKEYEQAGRQRWRALALVIKAKLEAVGTGIVTFEEEFLAHIVLPSGRTVTQDVTPRDRGGLHHRPRGPAADHRPMTALRTVVVLAAFTSVVLTAVQALSLLAPGPGPDPSRVAELAIVSVVLIILAVVTCAPRTESR